MKRNKGIRIILLLTICATGSILFGYNVGKINDGLHLVLNIVGLAMVSCSLAMLGQAWRRK